MITTKIKTGKTVLAHEDGRAKTYTNRAQAERVVNGLTVRARVYQSPTSRVFFVEIVEPGTLIL